MSRLTRLFARRYLFSKKSHSVINIISGVSAFAVAVPVMAMVILLSVFNGFEGLVKQMYTAFDPDLLVTPVTGKVFETEAIPHNQLKALAGVEELSYALEENALFAYRDRQYIGVMRGVDSLYDAVSGIRTMMAQGEYRLQFGDMPEAVVGQGVAYTLGINTALYDQLHIYTPRRGKINTLLPLDIYRQKQLSPAGIFALEAEVDGQYVLVPLSFAQELLNHEGKASSLAVKLTAEADHADIQRKVAALLGDRFEVRTRYQQKESFYRIMIYEKWGIYFISLLVLIVASFSLIGSLAMLIIDKRGEIRTLYTMGADYAFIRRVFVTEGVLIYALGAFGGLILGVLLALGQQHFGWLKISAGSFLVDAYPVEVHLSDLGWVAFTCCVVSLLISILTVRTMIKPETRNRINA